MPFASRLSGMSPRRLGALAGTRTGVLAITTGGSLVVRTINTIILTRLLSPEAFGVFGIINSLLFVVAMLTDLGFQSYVVRHERGDEPHFLDVIWTIHVVRGFGLTLFAAAASPVLAWLLAKPEMALPLAVTSLTFVVTGLASLSLMTALRHDGSRKLSVLDLVLQIFQAIVCVLLALWWRNAWALIAALLLQGSLRAVLSYALFPASGQRFARDRAISVDFMAFSRVVLVSSSVMLLIAQSDKLMLARLLTLDQYGLYAIALNLASAPISFADAYIGRVTFPIYASTWRDRPDELPKVYYAVSRLPGLLYGLGSGALLGGSMLIVAILYDPRYARAAPYLSLLMISSTLRFPNFAAAELLTAIGRIKGTLHANLVRLCWLFALGIAGYFAFGPLGLIAAVGTVELPALVFNWVALKRVGILDMKQELLFVAVAVIGAGVGFAGSELILTLFPHF